MNNENYFPITFISEGNNSLIETKIFKLFKKANINISFEKIKAGFDFFEKGLMTGYESDFLSKIKLNKILILDEIMNIYRKGYEDVNQEIVKELKLYTKKYEIFDNNFVLRKNIYQFINTGFSRHNYLFKNFHQKSSLINLEELDNFISNIFKNHPNSNIKFIVPNDIDYFFKNGLIDAITRCNKNNIDILEIKFLSAEMLNIKNEVLVFFSESSFIVNEYSKKHNFTPLSHYKNDQNILMIMPSLINENFTLSNIDLSVTLFVSKILELIGYSDVSDFFIKSINANQNEFTIEQIKDLDTTDKKEYKLNENFAKSIKDRHYVTKDEQSNLNSSRNTNEDVKEIEVTFLGDKKESIKEIMVNFFNTKISINKVSLNGKLEFINELMMENYQQEMHTISFFIDNDCTMNDILILLSKKYKILNIFFIYSK